MQRITGSFSQVQKRPGSEANHSPPSSAGVNNDGAIRVHPPLIRLHGVVLDWFSTGTTLPYLMCSLHSAYLLLFVQLNYYFVITRLEDSGRSPPHFSTYFAYLTVSALITMPYTYPIFLGVKRGRRVRLTTLPPSVNRLCR
jgi:hypothetical protein